MFDPHLDDHSDDIPQPPPYDGPDWDEDDVPTASCVVRTPEIQRGMDHKIQED